MLSSVPASGPPEFALVVPTRNEGQGIAHFLTTVQRTLEEHGSGHYELVLVDDSDDDTCERVTEWIRAGRKPPDVRLVHRPPGQRGGGLAGALVHGFTLTRAPVVVVMDSDLQHPPDVVPELMAPLMGGQADLTVGTRYRRGGSAGGLGSGRRRLASQLAAGLCHRLFPGTRGVSDPCGGLFAFSAGLIRDVELRPVGFKILLELLVRCPDARVTEVPYAFAPRTSGSSKATLREAARFARHASCLYVSSPHRLTTGPGESDRRTERAEGPLFPGS